jgi:hypothetical protein
MNSRSQLNYPPIVVDSDGRSRVDRWFFQESSAFPQGGFFVYRKRKSSGWDEQCLINPHPPKTAIFDKSFSSSDFDPKNMTSANLPITSINQLI